MKKFDVKKIIEYIGEMNQSGVIDKALIQKIANDGLFSLLKVSRDRDPLKEQQFLEHVEFLASFDLSFAMLIAGQNICTNVLKERFVKKELLDACFIGEQLIGFSVTEKEAGSNHRNIATKLTKINGEYYLNGEKYYSGLGHLADQMIVFAKFEDDYISVLVPMNSEGVKIKENIEKLGLKSYPSSVVEYNNVKISPENLLSQPSCGLEHIKKPIRLARLAIGSFGIGIIKRILQLISDYAHKRRIATGLLIDNPSFKEKINDSFVKLRILEQIREKIFLMDDIPEELILVFKNLSSEFSCQVCDHAVQITGGKGYDEKYIFSKLLRDTRALRIIEGPTETLTYYLGTLVLSKFESIREKGFSIYNSFIETLERNLNPLEMSDEAIYHAGRISNIGLALALLPSLSSSEGRYLEKLFLDMLESFRKKSFLFLPSKTLDNEVQKIKDQISSLTIEGELLKELSLNSQILKGRTIDCGQSFIESFRNIAEAFPDHSAVIQGNRKTSFQEIDESSNAVCSSLLSKLKKGNLVLIAMPKSPELISVVLACLKSEIAFKLMSPGQPKDRIIENLKPNAMIEGIDQIEIFDQFLKLSDDISYIVSTSGTTGIPNHVMVSKESVSQYIHAVSDLFSIGVDARMYLFLSLDFDVAVGEVLLCLAKGATLCLPARSKALPDAEMIKELESYQATHLEITSSSLSLLPITELPLLKCLIIGGEPCSVDLVKKWKNNRTIFNAYGPAEATIVSTVFKYDNGEEFPIGTPLPNKTLRIGDNGELLISGWISSGYYNNSELNKKRFSEIDGVTYYKSGDRVELNGSGQLVFIGRTDNQIKIRGMRIEPEEIEKRIKEINAIEEAIVTKDGAFIQSSDTICIEDILSHLSSYFPEYMIPSSYFHVSCFNYTQNGKLDRKNLPKKFTIIKKEKKTVLTELNNIQKKLEKIWIEITDCHDIDLETNFFHIGGDSLSIIKLANKIKEHFNVKLRIEDLFDHCEFESQSKLVGNFIINSDNKIEAA